MFTGPTGTIEIQRGQLEASTRETGPNDFGRVVWALGVFFFFSICVFFITKLPLQVLQVLQTYGEANRSYYEVNGPKRPLTCRLGRRWFFFFYHRVFLLLNYIYRCYRCYRHTESLTGGYYGVNGPKRPPTCRLGDKWVFFFYLCVFFVTKLHSQVLQLL